MNDDELDEYLRNLPRVSPSPFARRAILSACEKNLAARAQRTSLIDRAEPLLVVTIATAHLVWAIMKIGSP